MWNTASSLFWGQTKLESNFPWNMQTAGKRYFVALLHFAIGSFAIPLLVIAPVFALASYHPALMSFLDISGIIKTLAPIGLVGAAFGLGTYYLILRRKGLNFDFNRRIRAMFVTIISAILTMWLFALTMHLLEPVYPQVIQFVSNVMSTPDGKPRMSFIMGLSTLSFVTGFGLQMRYIAGSLRKEGHSLSSSMALNLDKRRGSWWGATAFNVIWPVAVTYLLWQGIGETIVYFMGQPHQPTVDLAKAATGGNFLLFALMAAVGAPIFEEIVFRGFLFNIIRSSLARPHAPLTPLKMPESGFLLGLRRFVVNRRNKLRQFGHSIEAAVHGFLGRNGVLSAVVISSLLFALMHMQFNPTTLVLLFVLGCMHAELYRRTGSLYCSILLHALNNGLEVFKIGMGG